ncbi:TPA: hypothetical protein U2T46_002984 [Burkholderia cenocepacia]|nr:hypothetical protein [Burkholderia cenocepacia]
MENIDSVKQENENAPQNQLVGFHEDGIAANEGSDEEESLLGSDEEQVEVWEQSQKESQRQILSLVECRTATEDAAKYAREHEPNLIKRARTLVGLNAFNFRDIKWNGKGEDAKPQAISTDMNRMAAFRGLFGEKERPHFDEFSGRVVDHRGAIIDDQYSILEVFEAVDAAGLKLQSADTVKKALVHYALSERRNDLIESFSPRIPEWDSVPRLDSLLIGLFKLRDTPLNRRMSRYFFLSLYARIFSPGCLAPIVPFLVGGQNAGKSHFGRLICQYVLDDKDADTVSLDLSADRNDFLREVTGASVIASIGEMSGFNKGEMTRIKDFVTKTSDSMHFKYFGNIQKPRAWVMLMDGNEYSGLQRDSSGNRRFMPLFVAQTEDDENGQPQWDKEFKADFSNFESDFFQVMAEARSEYDRLGEHGYVEWVTDLVSEVKKFNHDERAQGRGVIRDEHMEQSFGYILSKCNFIQHVPKMGTAGIRVSAGEFASKWKSFATGPLNPRSVKEKMEQIGARHTYLNGMATYVFDGKTRADIFGGEEPTDSEHQSF